LKGSKEEDRPFEGGSAHVEASAGSESGAYCGSVARCESQAFCEGDARQAAVFCVGNRLMMDDGIGPAAYDALQERYIIPPHVHLYDVGCMSLDMLPKVEAYDFILTVDAIDGIDDAPGTVYRFEPDAMARHSGPTSSLHDIKLIDLFDAASLLGYEAEGYCVGMRVENAFPSEYVIGLTPACEAALPLLLETIAAELHRHGFEIVKKPE
jgi:hydrogenase maturation protease